MKFAIFYQNNPEARGRAMQVVQAAINQKIDLSVTPVNHPFGRIVPSWPSMASLAGLQPTDQCEHMEIKDGAIHSVKLSTIDIEATVQLAPEPTPPEPTPVEASSLPETKTS